MSPDWIASRDHAPSQSNYYLATMAPRNVADIPLENTQRYAQGFARMCWYNSFTKRWYQHRPGSGKSFECTSYVTHWAVMPSGATPSQADVDALPGPHWEPIHFNLLDKIGMHMVVGRREEALRLLREELAPLLEEGSRKPGET
jgi:hypothetical protein